VLTGLSSKPRIVAPMRKAIRLSDFRRFNEAERTAALHELAVSAGSHPNGEPTLLEARIRSFESQYEMTSDQMRARVAGGQLSETRDIASWLMALDVRRRLRAGQARP
jgi:hypothetical protein